MSRRRPKGELQFGSDSFLDVVANIVGILIILIVIAGLRVSQTPIVFPSKKATNAETSQPAAVAVVDRETDKEPTKPPVVIRPAQKSDVKPTRDPLPAFIVPKDLVDLTGNLEEEIANLKLEETNLTTNLKLSVQQQKELIERQKAISAMLAQTSTELDANRKQAIAFDADMELARETLLRLTRQVEALENKPANILKLEHKITPVSRVVNGNEKHYRLEKNRVAEVPVDELVSRLKEQIDRRKDWLVKTRQHQGQIGPAHGFRMNYLVRVDTLSGLEESRAGQGGYRISLSHWDIHPEPETKGESEELALRKGSQFYQSIIGAAPDTTLTFWVYPDSYPIYRKLQRLKICQSIVLGSVD
jgi:hypothetical protein